jgi:hypothetical protein
MTFMLELNESLPSSFSGGAGSCLRGDASRQWLGHGDGAELRQPGGESRRALGGGAHDHDVHDEARRRSAA